MPPFVTMTMGSRLQVCRARTKPPGTVSFRDRDRHRSRAAGWQASMWRPRLRAAQCVRAGTGLPSSQTAAVWPFHPLAKLYEHMRVAITKVRFGGWASRVRQCRDDRGSARLPHHGHIVEIGNESWRFRQSVTKVRSPGKRPGMEADTAD